MALYGNCHCGAHRFTLAVGADALAAAVHTDAAGTPAAKLGALWAAVDGLGLDVTRDDGTLTAYAAGDVAYEFCGVCGTAVYGTRAGTRAGTRSVNVRTLRGIDVFALEPAPVADADTATELPAHGSCICGAVTVTLQSLRAALPAKQDNCSICARNAWVGVYPPAAQVAVTGKEHTRDYQFGKKFMGHPFCITCGVHVHMNVYGPPAHVVAQWPAARQAMVRQKLDIAPVNVRVLDGIDLGALAIERTSEGTEGYEASVGIE